MRLSIRSLPYRPQPCSLGISHVYLLALARCEREPCEVQMNGHRGVILKLAFSQALVALEPVRGFASQPNKEVRVGNPIR